ncbi:hypothetical protein ACFLQI_01880 [Candidatus Undinarchaeota archaeon]
MSDDKKTKGHYHTHHRHFGAIPFESEEDAKKRKREQQQKAEEEEK